MTKRLQLWREATSAYLDGLEGEDRIEALRHIERETFGESREQNRRVLGYVPGEEIRTDGVVGKRFEQMAVGGQSVQTFDLASDIVPFALQLLARIAPRRTGKFASAFLAIVDGRVLAPPYILPDGFDQIRFVNLLPYARKLEGGKGFRPTSKQRPNGYMEALAYPELKARYGDQFRVWFGRGNFPQALAYHTAQRRQGDRGGRTRNALPHELGERGDGKVSTYSTSRLKGLSAYTGNDRDRATRQFPYIGASLI